MTPVERQFIVQTATNDLTGGPGGSILVLQQNPDRLEGLTGSFSLAGRDGGDAGGGYLQRKSPFIGLKPRRGPSGS